LKTDSADQTDLRALLRDYVNVLLDTGARPGKELLNLKWIQVEISVKPTVVQTGVIDNTDDDHDEIFLLKANRAVILNIQQSKTKVRKAIGRLPTIKALDQIAQRNFGKSLKDVLKVKSEDYIFQFPAFINPKKVGKVKRKQGFIRPTSFPKLFQNFLEDHNLLIDPITGKDRPLYCLRHTYATIALANDKVHIHTLGKQMGTSVKMIEQHYSHLDAVKAIDQLRGDESRELINTPIEITDKHKYKPPAEPRSNKSKK
jgi:integrase